MPKGIKIKNKKVIVSNGNQQKSIMSYFTTSTSKSSPLAPINKRMNEFTDKDSSTDLIMTTNKTEVTEDCLSLDTLENCPSTPPPKRIKLNENGSASQSSDTGGHVTCNISNELNADAPLTPELKTMVKNKAVAARLLKLSQSLKVLDPTMGTTWFDALENEFKKEYFKELNDLVMSARERGTVYPPLDNVFEWTKQCPIRDVKVVILGQDPYHGPNQAHGLCFSVKKGVPAPPSLVNMYKELTTDIEGFQKPNHGCLTGWAEQGVLLLNAVLTVEAGKANSHKDKGWEKVTDAVISWISKNLDSVVFLLWGAYAQKKAAIVDKTKHHLLQTVHPSPLSAHRGFLGCKHFSKCNELLQQSGKEPINWTRLP